MRSLAPRIKVRHINADRSLDYYYESVIARFERIMTMLEETKDTKATIKHKEELFGTNTEFAYPDQYSMVGLGKELVGSFPEFREMLRDPKQVRMAAQMIAQKRLEGVVEVLIRHEGIVRRNKEKIENKANQAKSKSKGKRRR
jgi:hypothetical protein